ITEVSLSVVILRGLTLLHLLLAVESLQYLVNPANDIQRNQAAIDLTLNLSELVLDAMLTVGVANVMALGAAGVTCITLVLASFFHKFSNDKEKVLIAH